MADDTPPAPERQDIVSSLAADERSTRDALRTSEEQYRALVDNTNDVLYAADPDGKLRFLGQQFARYGHPPEEVIERGVFHYIVEEDRQRVLADLERTAATGEEFPTRFRIRTADGGVRWLEDHGRLARDAGGNVTGLWGVLRDVTERMEAEQALRASEERFRRLTENSFDAIIEVDPSGRVAYASPAAERITGVAPAELVGESFLDLLQPDQHREALDRHATLLQGGVVESFRIPLSHRAGHRVMVEVNVTPLFDEQGQVIATQAVVRDVTERERLEQQMRQMQKMEAIGNLASGVAHDFNNLLTGILGYANLLTRLTEPESEVHRGARVIEQAATRASELTQQLLGFARQGKLRSQPVDLHRTVDEVVALLGRTVDPRITIERRLRAERSQVRGDPGQLQQVLLNLAVNARDAMPDGGALTLSTEVVDLPPGKTGQLAPGPHLALTVQDTGCGIPPELQGRLFEPFFTTKPRGEGSGMGLATVYGIVRNHGGAVELESEPGQGSRFRVLLPLCDGEEQPVTPAEPCVGGAGRVMLVDDEDVVCTVAIKMLTRLGYEVCRAATGEQALELFREREERGERIDLVVLDLVMPGMGGRECFRALRGLAPGLPVLLCTGHALDSDTREMLREPMVEFLAKPFVLSSLGGAVARLLQREVS